MNVTQRSGAHSAMNVYENAYTDGPGKNQISVSEFVRSSFRNKKGHQSELNYQPNDRYLKKNIQNWKAMPPKTSFLDPIIKTEKIKLAPTAYSTHSNWTENVKDAITHGHARKGMFQPRERPLITEEFMKEAKKKARPRPGGGWV